MCGKVCEQSFYLHLFPPQAGPSLPLPPSPPPFPPPPLSLSSPLFTHGRWRRRRMGEGGREGGTTIPGGGRGKGRRMEVKGGGGDAAFQTGRWSKSSSHRRPSVVRTGWPPGFGQEGFKASDGHSRMEEEEGLLLSFPLTGTLLELSLSLFLARNGGRGSSRSIQREREVCRFKEKGGKRRNGPSSSPLYYSAYSIQCGRRGCDGLESWKCPPLLDG